MSLEVISQSLASFHRARPPPYAHTHPPPSPDTLLWASNNPINEISYQ